MVVVAAPGSDGTVSIDIDWPNAQAAFALIEAAQQTFLEARQSAETAAIGESIGILERYSATLHDNINATMTELQRAQGQRRSAPGSRIAHATTPRVSELPSVTSMLPPIPDAALASPALGLGLDDPEIPRLKAAATAKRQEITNLEQNRQRQLSELQAKLEQLSLIYTASHPSVMAVQRNLNAIAHDSPQLVALKAETEKIEAEYDKRAAAAEELLQAERLHNNDVKVAIDAGDLQKTPARAQETRAATPPTSDEPTMAQNNDSDFASVRLRELELSQRRQAALDRTLDRGWYGQGSAAWAGTRSVSKCSTNAPRATKRADACASTANTHWRSTLLIVAASPLWSNGLRRPPPRLCSTECSTSHGASRVTAASASNATCCSSRAAARLMITICSISSSPCLSALAPATQLRQPKWATEAARVVTVQRIVQAIYPARLAVISDGTRSYVLKELQPAADRLDLTLTHRPRRAARAGDQKHGRNHGVGTLARLLAIRRC